MQSCLGPGSQSQEQRAGRRRPQIIAKCLSTVGPRCRKVWTLRQETRNLSACTIPIASLQAPQAASLCTGPLCSAEKVPCCGPGCVYGEGALRLSPILSGWQLSLSVEGAQEEKFREET